MERRSACRGEEPLCPGLRQPIWGACPRPFSALQNRDQGEDRRYQAENRRNQADYGLQAARRGRSRGRDSLGSDRDVDFDFHKSREGKVKKSTGDRGKRKWRGGASCPGPAPSPSLGTVTCDPSEVAVRARRREGPARASPRKGRGPKIGSWRGSRSSPSNRDARKRAKRAFEGSWAGRSLPQNCATPPLRKRDHKEPTKFCQEIVLYTQGA